MKELISVFLGQAGIQIGESCLEQFSLENGITPSGYFSAKDNFSSSSSCHNLFDESSSGTFTFRSIFIDFDSDTINHVKKGPYKSLLTPENYILGKESMSDNFSKARYSCGSFFRDECLEATRKQVEKCDSFEGFIFYHSAGGGTGAGISSLLYERYSVNYKKNKILSNVVFPSPNISPSCVEPINSILCISYLIDKGNLVVCYDNQSLYKISAEQLDAECTNYKDINRIIASNVSNLTRCMRFEGENDSEYSLRDIFLNLLPYQRQTFCVSSYSPWIPSQKGYCSDYSIHDITCQAFDSNAFMIHCDVRQSKLLSSSLFYNGDINLIDVIDAVTYLKLEKTIKFVNNCPQHFNTHIRSQPIIINPQSGIAAPKRSVTTLCNSTGIHSLFSMVSDKFESLYSKRAFIHWFVGEGMESGEFEETYENVRALQKDYIQLEQGSAYANDKYSDEEI